RGETPSPQNDCSGQEGPLNAGLLMYRNHTSNPAAFDNEVVRCHASDPVGQAVCQSVLVQRIPQPTTATGWSVPAWHAVAFLLIEAVPLHAAFDPPLVEVGIRVLDIEARPRLVRGTLTPRSPVLECQVRRVCDAMLVLQPCTNADTATA